MRVLIVSQYYWPESFRINEIAESLQRAGCEITVLTGQPNYPEGRIYPGYRALGAGCEQHADHPIYRVPMVPRGSGGAWRLIFNYFSFVFSASLLGSWLLRKRSFDVILVYGMSPILQAIPGIVLKRLKRARLVTWVQDLWPESMSVAGYVKHPWLLGLVGVVVRWIYRCSDLLLVQSRAFVPIVESMAGGVRVCYQPNPGELSASGAGEQAAPAVILEPAFNVVFAGNLGTVQALPTVLEAAERVRNEPDVRIVFIGGGSRRTWLMHEASARRLDNVRFIDRLPPQAMPPVLAQASVLLVSLTRSPTMSRTIPSKIQAYLAAGRPILACLDGEGARVIEEARAGLTCPAEDGAALAQAILRMKRLPPEELQRMAQAGRCYYRRHFDPLELAQTLVGHFRDTRSSTG